MTKLWHDDVRLPPDDTWTWVKNNKEAREVIEDNLCEITEMSLDHDLGADMVNLPYEQKILLKGDYFDNGYELVKWMCGTKNIPPNATINVHSWNPVGAKKMVQLLEEEGCKVTYSPFTP